MPTLISKARKGRSQNMTAQKLNAMLAKPFAEYEDDTEKGSVDKLTKSEIKTGVAFYDQGKACVKAGITSSESAKWSTSKDKPKASPAKKTEKQLLASATAAAKKLNKASKEKLYAELATELGHEA